MAGQLNKLLSRKNQVKPLLIKAIRYVGIKKIEERPDPLYITTMEAYSPSKESGRGLSHSLARVKHRHKSIPILTPATHEVHLAKETISESMAVIGDYHIQVAAITTITGSTRTLLNNRLSGVTVFIHGEGENETAYFKLTWKDVLENPMKEPNDGTYEQNKRRRERCRYPTENLSRIEEGVRVYYVQKATPQEFTRIMEALKGVDLNNQRKK